MNLPDQFKSYLLSLKHAPSHATVKNYKADVASFIRWFETRYGKQFDPSGITPLLIDAYKFDKTEQAISARSLERHISSLRKFFHYLKLEGIIASTPFEQIAKAKEEQEAKTDPWSLKDFKSFLFVTNASALTIKNYVIDVKQFMTWAQEVVSQDDNWNVYDRNVFRFLSPKLVEEYKDRLLTEANLSPVSINRKLSSLRRYLDWTSSQGLIESSQNFVSRSLKDKDGEASVANILETHAVKTEASDAEVSPFTKDSVAEYSKIPPIRLIQKVTKGIDFIFELIVIAPFAKLANTGKYALWILSGKQIFEDPKTASGQKAQPQLHILNFKKEMYAPAAVSTSYWPWHKKLVHHARYTRPKWYKNYHSYPLVHYFHFAVLVIFMSILGFGMYQVLFGTQKSPVAAAPATPLRILSFQGRLTDASDNPITDSKLVRFIIYDNSSSSGSARLWEEVRRINPDTDGIFSSLLGENGSGGNASLCNSGSPPTSPATGACGIPQSLFRDNASLWLGITIGETVLVNESELTPRQQIATVAYATNAEVLQGLPPTTDAGVTTNANAVLALNSSGTVSIPGSAVTTIQASGGQFKLMGQTVRLETNVGSAGNIIFAPDGFGLNDFHKPLTNTSLTGNILSGAFEIDDKVVILATESAHPAFLINNTSTGDLFTASNGATTRFVITSGGNVGIGRRVPNFALDILGSASLSATLSLAPLLQVDAGSCTAASAGKLYYDATNNSYYYCNGTTWTQVGSGSGNSWFDQKNGALYPLNSTVDFFIGGQSTVSAKFAILNMNSGTPVASIAGTFSLGSAAGTTRTIGATAMNALQLGDAQTGDLIFAPANSAAVTIKSGGNVGIGTTSPLARLDIRGANATTPGATISATSNFAALVVDQRGLADIFTASTGGVPKFTINNDGRLTSSNYTIAGGIFYANSTGTFLQTTQGGATQCLIGGAVPSWSSCSTGVTTDLYWNQTSGLLYTNNSTVDFAIGGQSSTSAKFLISQSGTNATASIAALTSFAGVVIDQRGVGDIFSASTSGLPRFTIANNGNVGIGSTIPLEKLQVEGNATVSGNLTFFGGPRSIQTTGNNTLTFGGNTTGNILLSPLNSVAGGYIAPSTNNVTDLGQVNLAFRNAYAYNFIASGASGIQGWWQRGLGAVAPTNITDDLLIGGSATASAKFQVYGFAPASPSVPAGTASTSGYLTFAGTGTNQINLLNNSNLNILRSPSGDAGEATVMFLGNNGNVGIGTITPAAKLSVNGRAIITSPVASSVFITGGNETTTGTSNTVIGNNALTAITSGDSNTAIGADTLTTLTSGTANTVIGRLAGTTSTGSYNTFIGGQAVAGTATGSENVAIGYSAGNNLTGADNVFVGVNAGQTVTSGSYNTLLGNWADVSPGTISKSIAIGASAVAKADNQLVIGAGGTNIINDVYIGEGVTDSSPAGFTLNATGGSGADKAGAHLTLAGGKGTGNAVGGSLIFQTSDAGSSGSTLQSLSTKMIILGSGNVGIGTTSPIATFDVRGNTATTPAASISATSNFAAFVVDQRGTGDIFTASSSGLPRFTITSGGNVGIGSLIPTEKLFVEGNATVSGHLTLAASGTLRAATGALNLAYKSGGNAWTTGLTLLDNSGNVGIGTTNPSYFVDINGAYNDPNSQVKLAVGGSIISGKSGSEWGLVKIYSSSGRSFSISEDDTNNSKLTNSFGDITIAPTSNTILNPSTGNVGIGTTGPTSFILQTAGSIGPNADLTYDLGSSSLRWRNIYSAPAGVSGYWQRASGALAPAYITDDLLIGGISTASAKFQVYGLASGTPNIPAGTASTSGYLTFAGTGTNQINLLNNSNLNFTHSPSGDAGTSSVLYLQNSGNVGIGTTIPTANLHIVSSNGATPVQIWSTTNTPQFEIGRTANDFYFGVAQGSGNLATGTVAGDNVIGSRGGKLFLGALNGGAAAIVTTTGGNVGIGTSSPVSVDSSAKGLQIGNSMLLQNVVGTQAMFSQNAYYDGSWKYITTAATAAMRIGANNAGEITFHSASSGTAGSAIGSNWDASNIRLVIQNGGNIGINTTAPIATLDVRGNTATTPAASASANSNFAALVVDQRGSGEIFTASYSGQQRFTIANNGTVTTANGTFISLIPDSNDNSAFTFNTSSSLTASTAKLLSVKNNGTEKMYLDATGNLYVSGSVTAGSGFTVTATNKSGGTISSKSLVILDPTNNTAFTTTTSAYQKGVFGVMQGVEVNGDTDKDGACDADETCLIAVAGKVNVTTSNASTAQKGDYLFTSSTAGAAVASAKQFDGLVGVVSSTANAGSGYLEMIFKVQPQVTAGVAIDRSSKHNEYRIMANDYQGVGSGTNPYPIQNVTARGLFFDNFLDGTKTDSVSTPGAVQVSLSPTFQTPSSNLASAPYRVGLMNGQTYATSTTDNSGNTYLASNTVNKVFYYDRTRDSSPATLVSLGIDPNWYNGVTLSVATSSGNFTSAASGSALLQVNPNLTTSYNGSLLQVTGNYASNAKTIYITIKNATSSGVPIFDWSDYNGNSQTSVVMTPGTSQRLGNTGVSVNFTNARYNTGDTFRIASWFVEPSGSTRSTKAQFPERSYLIGTAADLEIIDADTQKLWMKFNSSGSDGSLMRNQGVSSISMINGTLYAGLSSTYALSKADFVHDTGYLYFSGGILYLPGGTNNGIAGRNVTGSGVQGPTTPALVSSTVNDVSAAVVPNQPTQTVTVSGWGYIQGDATSALAEKVNFPYLFNNPPTIRVTAAGNPSVAPASFQNCGTNGSNDDYAEFDSQTTNGFRVVLRKVADSGTYSTSTYLCYSWEATGVVSPKTGVAVATEGGVTFINETDQTAVNSSETGSFAKVFLTSGGTLYQADNTSNDLIVRVTGYITSQNTGFTNIIQLPYSRVANSGTANSLFVTEGTSTLDGKGDTLYIGSTTGASAVQLPYYNATSTDANQGVLDSMSVKYYTAGATPSTGYITEEMVGDIRGMWPLSNSIASASGSLIGKIEDASIKGNSLTEIGRPTFVSGVRDLGVTFNGTSQYLNGTGADLLVTKNFSVGGWINPTSNGLDDIYFSEVQTGVGGCSTCYNWIVGANTNNGGETGNGNIKFSMTNGAWVNADSGIKAPVGQWTYVVGVHDGNYVKIYVNGQLRATTAITGSNANDTFRISGIAGYFDGKADEVFLTKTVLTDNQILHMYEVGYRALQSHSGALGGGGTGDANQRLAGATNTLGDTKVDFNNQFAYIGTNDTTNGRVTKIDLISDTNVKNYNKTANVPGGGTLLVDNDTKSLAVGYNLEIVGSATSGVKSMAPIDLSDQTNGTFLSKTLTTQESFSQAYLWSQHVTDSQDTTNAITVYASNDGGTSYVQGTLTNTDSTQTPPEYEYFFQFNNPGSSLKVKYVFARGSTKTSTYVTRYGMAWLGADVTALIPGGNGLFTTSGSVADGSYLEVAHNQNTSDMVANGWMSAQSLWKQIDGTYKPAIAWEGKDLMRQNYHDETLTYQPVGETNIYSQNTLEKGMLFDTFEDSTKMASNSATAGVTLDFFKLDNASGSALTNLARKQAGRIGLIGGQTYATSTSDNDGKAYLGSNTVNDVFYYDRIVKDSSPATLVSLGIDPNWAQGVTLAVGTTSANFTTAASGSALLQVNPNLTTAYNGSVVKVAGRYNSGLTARTIYITINTPTSFSWTDYNGRSGGATQMSFGSWQTLSDTGVSVNFTNTRYNPGDTFKIASWFVEPIGVNRGARQDFPERSYIFAEGPDTAQDWVDIIDADTQKVWMRFDSGSSSGVSMLRGSYTPKSSTALNGKIYIGTTNGGVGGVFTLDFIHDIGNLTNSNGFYVYNGSMADRNAGKSVTQLSSTYATVNINVNDVSPAVIPNQPTQTTTVSGWGAFATTSSQTSFAETVNLPYKFNSPPAIAISGGGFSTGPPTRLEDCRIGAGQYTVTYGITTTNFVASMNNAGNAFGGTNEYRCYTWAATGVVSPRQYIAVGTDGGTSLINETDQTVTDFERNADIADDIRTTYLQLLNNGDLYLGSHDASVPASNQFVAAYYKATTKLGETAWAAYRDGYYLTQNQSSGWALNGPTLLGASTSDRITSLYATQGTSTIDGKSNTIYVGNNGGLTVLQERQSGATTGDGNDEKNGSVKYYTKDYISEEMVGDIRGMWPMYEGTGTSAVDVSVKNNGGAVQGNPTWVSGVRGKALDLDGTGDYVLVSTDVADYVSMDPFTVGIWLKKEANTDYQGIMGNYSGTAGWILATQPQTLQWHDGSWRDSGVTIPNDNGWHHVAVSGGTGVCKFYLDGVLVAQPTGCTISYPGGSGNLTIGAGGPSWLNYFNGVLDEAFITQTELTANQIRQIYERGNRALKSHAANLGGGSTDKNQQLGGSSNAQISNFTRDVKVDYNNQYMYVANSAGGNDASQPGAVSKIDLISDTNVYSYTSTPTSVPATLDNRVTSLAVGNDLEAMGSTVSGALNPGFDKFATATSGTWTSEIVSLPKSIGSAVLWVSPYVDAADTSSAITVKASADGGATYATCTLVNTDTNSPLPEREYSCEFATSGNQLVVKFEFARGSTKSNIYATQYGISWLGQTGYKIEQISTNAVRLYNYTGSTQSLRLDVITGGLGRNAGTVSLHPDAADVDTQANGNSIWVNKSGSGGNLMDLQASGTDRFVVTAAGNVGINVTNPLYTLHVGGATGSVGASKFYDADNSNNVYYMDMAATTTSASVAGSLVFAPGGSSSPNIAVLDGKNLNFATSPGGDGSSFANLSTKMTLTNAGNLGIGTTTPTGLLDVASPSGSLFNISTTQLTANVPAQFTAPGDVSIAYDINFTNPTASYIKSAAPMYLQSGETFNSSDLTLTTFNAGNIVLNAGNGATGSAAIIPSTDNTLDLGASASARFRSVYTGPGSFHVQCTTGDGCGQNLDWEIGSRTTAGRGNGALFIGVNGTSSNKNPLLSIAQNGSVGIGTTDPTRKLHIYGTNPGGDNNLFQVEAAAGNSYVRSVTAASTFNQWITTTGSQTWGMGTHADSDWRLYDWTNSRTPIFVKSSDGNVGIGATANITAKQVVLAGTSTSAIQWSEVWNDGSAQTMTGSGAGIRFRLYAYEGTGTTKYAGIAGVSEADYGDNIGLALYTRNGYNTNPTEKVRIKADGNVGIGTTSPAAPLQVERSSAGEVARFSAAGQNPYITVGNGLTGTTGGYVQWDDTNDQLILGVHGSSSVAIKDGAALMYVDDYGCGSSYFGIGAYATFTGCTNYALLNHTSAGHVYLNSVSGATVNIRTGNGNIANSAGSQWTLCYTTGGQVTYNAATTCATSSLRYKHDVLDLDNTSGLAELMQLNPVAFTYNADRDPSGKRNVGFIAEEVEAIDPRLVFYNDKGQIEGVKYENFTAILTKAIQEQQGQIASNSGALANLNLDSEGNVVIYENQLAGNPPTIQYSVKDSQGHTISQIAALSEAVIANVQAGVGNFKQITIAGQTLQQYIIDTVRNSDLVASSGTISPIAEVDQIHTNVISPLAQNTTININLEHDAIEIRNGTQTVAIIDKQGNASFSGQLASNSLVTQDATVSGTLRAGKIIADDIEGLSARIATLAASQVISNTYYVSSSSASTLPSLASTIPDTNNFVSLASFSGMLADVTNLSATTAFITEGMSVLGGTSMTDVTVTGQLSVGSALTLADNSINVLGSDLEIQPFRQGGVRFLSGLVRIDIDGNLTVEGNATFAKDVTVKGKLASNVVSPLAGQDLNLQLDSDNQKGLQVKNASGSGVLTINQVGDLLASGSATVAKLNFNIIEPALALSDTVSIATGSAGIATMSATQKELTIKNVQVTEKSLIYITPVGDTGNQVLYLLRQKAGDSFTVGTNQQVYQNVPFNWWIIN